MVERGLRGVGYVVSDEHVGLVAALRRCFPEAPRLAEWLADTAHPTLACYALARDDVRRKLRSTHAVERHHQEVRRRTRVIRIFPHEASLQRWLVTPTFLPAEHPMRRTA